jgi:hypothetical protein
MVRSDKGQRHNVRVGDDDFASLEEKDKVAPDSVRYVLTACRTTFNQGNATPNGVNQSVFAEILTREWPQERLGIHGFSRHIVSNLENGIGKIQYGHLEAYGRALGVPAGLLLLISRTRYEHAQNGVNPTVELLNKVIAALEFLKERVPRTGIDLPEDILDTLEAFRAPKP